MTNKVKILLVEDSTLVRFKIKKAFEQFDVELHELDNAEDIFKFSGRFQKMDLIILDINLPDMDGIAALEKMHKDEIWKSIPVIMLTGKSDRKTVEKAFKLGTVNYIRKPFTDENLLERVAQTLGKLPLSQENREVCSDEELHKLIQNEIERARLGSYKFSIMKVHILNCTESYESLDDLVNLRAEIKTQFRDIDGIFITKDYTYIIMLPFISEKEAVTISNKLYIWFVEKYDEKLKIRVATYPQDGDDSNTLLGTFKKSISVQNEH